MRTWPLTLAGFLITLAGLLGLLRYQVPETPLQTAPKCLAKPSLRPGYQADSTAIQSRGDTLLMSGNAWLEVELCRGQELAFDATGELGGKERPELLVFQDSSLVLRKELTDAPVHVKYVAPHDGTVRVAYLNDYHLDEARIATLAQISFRGQVCRTMSVSVPPETGGSWDAASATATLMTAHPMRVIPCSAGRLQFTGSGTSMDGQGTVLELKQPQSGVTRRLALPTVARSFSVEVEHSSLLLTIANEGRMVKADRNIRLNQIVIH